MEKLSQVHFGAAKRILRYVAGTVGYGVWYSSKIDASNDGKLYGDLDSDFASCIDDHRSISTHVFTHESGVIAWSSNRQPITTLSSTEAEYVTVTFAVCQAIWIRGVLGELQHQQKSATVIFCDINS